MTDTYGGLALPMPAPPFAGKAPDKALDAIGDYLQATLTAQLGAAWRSVAPGEELIKTVFTVSPQNALLNQSQLPALFIWPGRTKSTREAEDYLVTKTQVSAIWLLWWDSPLKREQRLPFQRSVTLTAHALLARGRHPAWVVTGDTTAGAATRGSPLLKQAGLFAPIDELETNEQDISLDPEKSGNPVYYKALSLSFLIAERAFRDPALWPEATSTSSPSNANPPTYPQAAALDLTVSQADNVIDVLKPLT
jgi:hypothetical protein